MARNKRKYAIKFSISVVALAHIFISAQQTPFTCATQLFHLIDTQRKELYTNDLVYPWRELMVRVWYPADGTNNNKISDKQRHYPLLIFSHGLGGQFNGDSYATLCQACVNAGYIVVTISHSYACKPVQFPDGRITTHSWSNVAQSYLSGREMDVWEADVAYVLNQIQQCAHDEHSFLYNKVDLDNIGMIGHSYGGAAAVQMCRKDYRIKAAVNLDGPLRGNNATVPCSNPVLFVIAAALPYTSALMGDATLANDFGWSYAMYFQEIAIINAFINAMQSNAHKVIIDGIRHTTFSDEIFLQYTVLDDSLIDPHVAHGIINAYVVDFFDTHLKRGF